MPMVGLRAEETDAYADSIISVTNEVLASTNALGAPDQAYADFMDKDQYIYFDLGEGEEGVGDLKLYIYLLNFGATFRVDFYDADEELLDAWSYAIQPGDIEVTADYDGTAAYRYVKVNATEEEVWKLDAIEVLELYTEPEEVPEEVPEEEAPGLGENSVGRLITLPDDGDSTTQYDSAVYVIGADGKRHAFPNETVYFSWFEDYDDVEVIPADEMSDYSLGHNVTIRPGTHLIKLQTSPKVYAVESGSLLREITTEEIAIDLYTENWNTLVVDVADGFWANYTLGDQITAAVHPSDTILQTPFGEIVYLSNSVYYSLPSNGLVDLRLQNDFYIPVREDIFSLYVDGGQLAITSEMQYPY